ncbi:hypothetical protein SPONN_1042 [uncultured Candidatus Thioglobus sp.]|nr:hypothetical protein SPONN_1042 [uncultured Candidatus Thioglobus sp.]
MNNKGKKLNVKKWLFGLISGMSKFEKLFWQTILVLLFIVIVLSALQENQKSKPSPEPPLKTPILWEESAKNLKKYKTEISDNLKEQKQVIHSRISRVADDLFNTNKVDSFLDFHYSVTGEYIELGMGAVGKIEQIVVKKLFGSDFNEKQNQALINMQKQFEVGTKKHTDKISKIALKDIDIQSNNKALTRLNSDIKANIQVQFNKVGAVAAIGIMSKLSAKMSLKIAKSAATKLSVKTLGKIAAKGGLAVFGASTGVLCGPAVAACAIVVGTSAWLATDYITIKLDKFWHRDEFKAEIIKLMNDGKQSFIKQYSGIYFSALDDLSQETQKEYTKPRKIKDMISDEKN